jgi:hypothetical protein
MRRSLGSRQLLALQQVPLLRDDQYCAELIPANLVNVNVNAQLQSSHQVQSPPDQQSLLRALTGVEAVKWAMLATLAIAFWRIGAQAGIAEFLLAQRPVHQEPERRIIRPLPR